MQCIVSTGEDQAQILGKHHREEDTHSSRNRSRHVQTVSVFKIGREPCQCFSFDSKTVAESCKQLGGHQRPRNGKSWGEGGGCKSKSLPWWGYGYFLEPHNAADISSSKRMTQFFLSKLQRMSS